MSSTISSVGVTRTIEPVAPFERGVDLVAGGDGVRAERAGRRIRVELPDRAREQVQEFLDRREVVGARDGARTRTDGPGGSWLRFVIDGPQRDRHPALFCSDPKSRQEARRHNFATMCARGTRQAARAAAGNDGHLSQTALKRTEADPMASLIEAIEIKRKMYFEFEDAPVPLPRRRSVETDRPRRPDAGAPEDAQPAHAGRLRQDVQGR